MRVDEKTALPPETSHRSLFLQCPPTAPDAWQAGEKVMTCRVAAWFRPLFRWFNGTVSGLPDFLDPDQLGDLIFNPFKSKLEITNK
jgi:hypothetical protein